MMKKESPREQAEKNNPETNASQLSPELRDKIKHPPQMSDVLRDLSADERRGNPALVPEMLDEPTDEIVGFTKD